MALLTDKERKRLKQRAETRTDRLMRRDTKRAGRQTRRIKAGTAKRAAGVRRSYARGVEQIQNTSLAGLTGRYRNEVEREIAGSVAGLEQAAPHHVNKVQARGQQRIRSINQSLRDAREATYDENFGALLDAARARVQERTQAGAERENEVAAAERETRYQIGRILPPNLGYLHSQATRDELVKDVKTNAGVSIQVARRVVEQMYRDLLPKLPPGVLSTRERMERYGELE